MNGVSGNHVAGSGHSQVSTARATSLTIDVSPLLRVAVVDTIILQVLFCGQRREGADVATVPLEADVVAAQATAEKVVVLFLVVVFVVLVVAVVVQVEVELEVRGDGGTTLRTTTTTATTISRSPLYGD